MWCVVLSVPVVSCAPSQPASESETSTTSEGVSRTAPAASSTLAPELGHTLTGEWLLTYTLDSVSDGFTSPMDPGDHDIRVVDMSPTCPAGPCDVEMSFLVPYSQEVVPGSARWTGDSYMIVDGLPGRGSCSREDGTVFHDGLDLTTTIELLPTEFSVSSSGWNVAQLNGTRVLEWTPPGEAARMWGLHRRVDNHGCPLRGRHIRGPYLGPYPSRYARLPGGTWGSDRGPA